MATEPFQHKKSLGQHFLNNEVVPRWLCEAGAVGAGDTVLEIGPGTGKLTSALLTSGATVVAVEADARALPVLHDTFAEYIAKNKLIIHHLDARALSPKALGLADHQYKVVSNIPYYLSGHLFRTLLESECQPTDLIFLVQREVAERIARDKKTSILSLSVSAFGNASYVRTVSAGHFTPPPKVDSAIIAIRQIGRDHFARMAPAFFFELLHLGFGQKRKQLIGNLSKRYPRSRLVDLFADLHLPPTVRAEDIGLTTWLALAERLSKDD